MISVDSWHETSKPYTYPFMNPVVFSVFLIIIIIFYIEKTMFYFSIERVYMYS